jgi:hypothetical protein
VGLLVVAFGSLALLWCLRCILQLQQSEYIPIQLPSLLALSPLCCAIVSCTPDFSFCGCLFVSLAPFRVCESDKIYALDLVHFLFANLLVLHPKNGKLDSKRHERGVSKWKMHLCIGSTEARLYITAILPPSKRVPSGIDQPT